MKSKTSSASPDTNCHSKVLIRCCAGSNWLHNTLFNVSSCVQKCGCQMSACWPLVSVGVLQRDCVTLHYSTSNSDALSSVSRACAQNTQNYIRPQALVDKISYISRLSIQNMFAAIQDFQKCYLYFVVCYNYEWCLLAVNAAINVFRQTVCNLCLSLAPNFIILQHYLLTKTGFKSKCWFYYWKIFNFQSFFLQQKNNIFT